MAENTPREGERTADVGQAPSPSEALSSTQTKPASLQLSQRVHVVLGAVNCAIIDLGSGEALLVDTGQDKDHGRRIRRALEALDLAPKVILNSHSHADHFGGNDYLLRQYPAAQVWAPEIEADIIRSPDLEPIYLFHGAKPLPELTSKWLKGPASPVHRVVGAGQEQIDGVTLELIDTRGHAHRQLAVLIDDVLLATDALFGAETLAKYPLPFAQDVGGQLAAFETVDTTMKTTAAKVLLPGHGQPTKDFADLVTLNRAAVERASAAVLAACNEAGIEAVLASVAEQLELRMTDLPRYHLNYTTVAAHLGYLRAEGRVSTSLNGGRLTWGRS